MTIFAIRLIFLKQKIQFDIVVYLLHCRTEHIKKNNQNEKNSIFSTGRSLIFWM